MQRNARVEQSALHPAPHPVVMLGQRAVARKVKRDVRPWQRRGQVCRRADRGRTPAEHRDGRRRDEPRMGGAQLGVDLIVGLPSRLPPEAVAHAGSDDQRVIGLDDGRRTGIDGHGACAQVNPGQGAVHRAYRVERSVSVEIDPIVPSPLLWTGQADPQLLATDHTGLRRDADDVEMLRKLDRGQYSRVAQTCDHNTLHAVIFAAGPRVVGKTTESSGEIVVPAAGGAFCRIAEVKLRRTRTQTGLQIEYLAPEGDWRPAPSNTALGGRVFDADRETEQADRHLQHSPFLLPFQPLSFRDFMLYEQHNIDAARGLIRRFHPGLYRAAAAYEKVTGRPAPQLRPKPLFYRQPIYYMGNAHTFVPTGTPVATPSYSAALDFELELGFVLSAPLLDATPAEAERAIGAFVVVNDFSARDVQRAEMDSGFGPQKSKHFLSSMSDTAVTADEVLPRIDALTGSVAINGATVSVVRSGGMAHGIGAALAHASRSEQLHAGELFATGTLTGGSGMETGHWLRPGDTLTLTLDGVGRVEHLIT